MYLSTIIVSIVDFDTQAICESPLRGLQKHFVGRGISCLFNAYRFEKISVLMVIISVIVNVERAI